MTNVGRGTGPVGVLHVLHDLDFAGAQTVVCELVTHLDRRRIRPMVCGWKRGGPLAARLDAAGIRAFTPAAGAPPRKPWTTAKFLASIIENENVRLLHAHMSDSAVWAALCAARRGIPFIITYHSNRLLPYTVDMRSAYGRLRFVLLRLAARRARVNIACSPEVRRRLVEELGLPESRIDVVPHGVEVPPEEAVMAAAAARRERRVRATDGGPRVVSVGRLVDIKGQDQLIAATPMLLERHPDATIILVGHGPRGEVWKAQARKLGVAEHVRFAGMVDDASPFTRSADVYVSTSHYEGISLSVLEAMAWRVPVVASDVPGNRDVVSHDVTGVRYPLGDTRSLADAILALLADPGRADRLATGAQALVLNSFTVEGMAEAYAAIYASVVAL